VDVGVDLVVDVDLDGDGNLDMVAITPGSGGYRSQAEQLIQEARDERGLQLLEVSSAGGSRARTGPC
jgi:hypothetical protein